MRADGTEQQRLTEDPARDYFPRWSPDGLWIAFVSERAGSFDIYLMAPDGSGPRRLTRDDRGDETCPAWRP